MDLFARKRLGIAAQGEWVSGDVVKALGEGALLVRGLSSDAARDAFASKARAAKDAERTADKQLLPSTLARHTREVLSEVCVLDARDLPYDAAAIREMVKDASYEALITAVIDACLHVDSLAQQADVSGNS